MMSATDVPLTEVGLERLLGDVTASERAAARRLVGATFDNSFAEHLERELQPVGTTDSPEAARPAAPTAPITSAPVRFRRRGTHDRSSHGHDPSADDEPDIEALIARLDAATRERLVGAVGMNALISDVSSVDDVSSVEQLSGEPQPIEVSTTVHPQPEPLPIDAVTVAPERRRTRASATGSTAGRGRRDPLRRPTEIATAAAGQLIDRLADLSAPGAEPRRVSVAVTLPDGTTIELSADLGSDRRG